MEAPPLAFLPAASASATAVRISATENGLVMTSWTMALRPWARSRWAANPVINRMVRSGKSRAAVSASAIPSITGIWISVSRRSNAPRSRIRISSASAPSSAVTVSWPSMATARATSVRMESSSSAISTRGMDAPVLGERAGRPRSCVAGGDIPLAEETYINIAAFGRRRSQSRLEPGCFARLQHQLVQHRVPGIDLGALGVANGKAQPRQLDRLAGFADDGAFDYQHRFTFHRLGGDLDVLECKPAQVHVEAGQFVECRGLWQQPHHVDAPDHQRQHQRAHGGADRRQADQRFARSPERRFHQPAEPRQALRAGGLGVGPVLPGYRRPVVFAILGGALAVGRPVGGYRGAVDDRGFVAVVFARKRVPFRGGVCG